MDSSPVADPKRLRHVAILLAGGLAVAGLAQAKLQILERDRTVALAKSLDRFDKRRVIPAVRGRILSSDGQPLAMDESTVELNVDFRRAPQSRAFLADLAAATGVPAAEFENLLAQGIRRRSWLKPLDDEQREAVDEVRRTWRADGVSVVPTGRRVYPFDEATAPLIGIRRVYAGTKGGPQREVETLLEKSLSPELTGAAGERRGMTDARGGFLSARLSQPDKAKRDGKDVVLTIDSNIQAAAFSAVRDAVVTHGATSGAAVVVDPVTGDLLAIANYPTFHANQPDPKDGNKAGVDYAAMSPVEPGSTFKILTLAKGLESGKVGEHNVIRCSGALAVGKRSRIRCDEHHGTRAHGPVDARLAIAKSCNVSAAIWAGRIGHDAFFKYIEDLGLTGKTNVGIVPESRGLLNYHDPAIALQLSNLGFGQSINTTPLGLASAFSMLANGGVRMRPRLVKSVGGRERVVEPAGPRLVSEANAKIVLSAMEACIGSRKGTGWKLFLPGYRLGGKTGTAQKKNGAGGYVSNFVGVVPVSAPRALVLVMVDDPKNAKYGGEVAGPAFRSIAQAVIRRYRIAPDGPMELPKPGTE